MSDKVILGIDPGSNIMGYGVVLVNKNTLTMQHTDVINMTKEKDSYKKMKIIFDQVSEVITTYSVNEVAIEAPFYGKNVQSMLKLGRAQGVAIAAALHHSLPVTEYAPRKVKQAVTGKGSGTKEQVAYMLQRILQLKELPPYFDQTDALAIAVCHYFQQSKPGGDHGKSGKGGWKSFINNNPDRIK